MKGFPPKYPLPQLLLERIYRIQKTFVDVTATRPCRGLAANRRVPADIRLTVLDPVDALAPARIPDMLLRGQDSGFVANGFPSKDGRQTQALTLGYWSNRDL